MSHTRSSWFGACVQCGIASGQQSTRLDQPLETVLGRRVESAGCASGLIVVAIVVLEVVAVMAGPVVVIEFYLDDLAG